MSKYDWDEPKDVMQSAADAVGDVKRRVGTTVRNWRYVLFLVAIVLLDVLRRFVVLGFDPEHILEAVSSAAVASMATLFAFYVYFPVGKHARQAKQSFKEIALRLKSALKQMRLNKLIDAFRLHCRDLSKQEEKEIKETQRDALKNRYLSDEDIETYSKLSKKELKKLVKNGTINEETKKLIVIYQKPVHCKPYAPAYFLAGLKHKREDAYLHGEGGYEARTLAMRPVFCVSVAVLMTAITRGTVQQTETALEILFSIALSICQILLAAFSGYCAGQTAAEHEELAMTAKAVFVEGFLESKGIDLVEENHESEAGENATET